MAFKSAVTDTMKKISYWLQSCTLRLKTFSIFINFVQIKLYTRNFVLQKLTKVENKLGNVWIFVFYLQIYLQWTVKVHPTNFILFFLKTNQNCPKYYPNYLQIYSKCRLYSIYFPYKFNCTYTVDLYIHFSISQRICWRDLLLILFWDFPPVCFKNLQKSNCSPTEKCAFRLGFISFKGKQFYEVKNTWEES